MSEEKIADEFSDYIEINIVDAPCGAGKTSSAINFIKNAPRSYKFIYITPYLEEVDRIRTSCKKKQFYSPKEDKNRKRSKLADLKRLLSEGRNIVTTHSLFHYFDETVIDLCFSQNYMLIMDEVTDVIEPFDDQITVYDKKILFEKYVDVGDNGLLTWRESENDYIGKFTPIKNLVDIGCLACYNSKEDDDKKDLMIWLFPVKVFKAFKKSYILTYMFNAQMQKYYYDFYGLKYKQMYIAGDSVDTYHFTDALTTYNSRYNYKELINFFNDDKLNSLDTNKYAFSVGWYKRNANNVVMDKLRKNLINFYNNKPVLYENGKYKKSSSKHTLWTTFSDFKDKLSGNGYAKGFESCNMRSTNKWITRSVIAYPINVFFHPFIKNFFTMHGVQVDEDAYALSEMIQFIWRSAIRKGEHITVYIPSSRMRMLLGRWVLENSNTEE